MGLKYSSQLVTCEHGSSGRCFIGATHRHLRGRRTRHKVAVPKAVHYRLLSGNSYSKTRTRSIKSCLTHLRPSPIIQGFVCRQVCVVTGYSTIRRPLEMRCRSPLKLHETFFTSNPSTRCLKRPRLRSAPGPRRRIRSTGCMTQTRTASVTPASRGPRTGRRRGCASST
jgi:hypothetical protein